MSLPAFIRTERLGQFYINGKWAKPHSTRPFPLINPASEEQIGAIILADEEDINRAVQAALTALASFSLTSKEERLKLLRQFLAINKKRLNDIAQAMSLEMGAPITMAVESQAASGIGHLESFISALEQQEESVTLENGDLMAREPIGVCGLITPWNWPVNQISLKTVPVLATGCCAILKPSEHTPLSAIIYAEMIEEAGYPPGVFNLVQGDGPIAGEALSNHPDIQMISFTGSTRAGKAITKAAAETIKRVTLELGGKSPNLVFADCDLEKNVRASVEECMFNTGQSCDAPTRLLVEKTCHDKVLEIAKLAANNIKPGDPSRPGNHIGPLFDKIQYDRVQAMIKTGLEEGAEIIAGGPGKPDGYEEGWFVKPTIFARVNNNMRIAREEIFGPVLVIIPFENEEEAIKIANDTPYGLAAYIQTGDQNRARRIASKLKAGAVHINGGGHNYGSPFGGFKQSGNGREGGIIGIEDYQEVKTIHFP